jgi:hypothetical protein
MNDRVHKRCIIHNGVRLVVARKTALIRNRGRIVVIEYLDGDLLDCHQCTVVKVQSKKHFAEGTLTQQFPTAPKVTNRRNI